MKNTILFLILFYFAPVLAAQISEPTIQVRSVTVDSFDTENLHLQIDLSIKNPNSLDLSVKKLRYRFSLELQPILEGEIEQKITLPGKEESSLRFPLTVRLPEILDKIEKLANKDTLIYGISGELTPGGALSAFKVPFESAGYIPNPRLPEIELSGVAITELSFTSVNLAVTLQINNLNSFVFQVDQFAYEMFISGQSLKKDVLKNLLSVAAKTKCECVIPVSLQLGEVIHLMDKLMGTAPVTVTIKGWADINTPIGLIGVPIEIEKTIQIDNP